MSKPTKQIIEYAKEQASFADYRFKVGAAVYSRSGFLLGRGYNKPNKTHPRARPPYYTIHAELAAILQATHFYSPQALIGSSIYVHRIRRDGLDGLAKPCSWCERLIKQVGIKETYYSI